jgi:hypothetical protein
MKWDLLVTWFCLETKKTEPCDILANDINSMNSIAISLEWKKISPTCQTQIKTNDISYCNWHEWP